MAKESFAASSLPMGLLDIGSGRPGGTTHGAKMTSWNQIKFQYEVMGKSVEELATEYQKSVLLLENTISQEGWTRKPVSESLTTWKNAEDPAEIMVEVAQKATLLNTMRATDLGPEYYLAEKAFIEKLTATIKALDASDPDTAKLLGKIADALVAMRPAQESPTQDGVDTGIVINVVGGYGANAHTSESVNVSVCDVTPRPKQLEN